MHSNCSKNLKGDSIFKDHMIKISILRALSKSRNELSVLFQVIFKNETQITMRYLFFSIVVQYNKQMQPPKTTFSQQLQSQRQDSGFLPQQARSKIIDQSFENRCEIFKRITQITQRKRRIAYIIFSILCAAMIVAFFRGSQHIQDGFQKEHLHTYFNKIKDHQHIRPFIEIYPKKTPLKILWLFIPTQIQASKMKYSIVGQNLMNFGSMDGFQVRLVNNQNAYDWLSNETIDFIKSVHQRSVVDIPVFELLRLALLHQHGGVSIRVDNIILMHGIGWVQELMNGAVSETYEHARSCGVPFPEVVMLHRDLTQKTIEVTEDVIIARPRAKIFTTLLKDIARIIEEGVWPYSLYNITSVDRDTEVVSFPKIVEALLNIYQTKDTNLCQQFGVESFHQSKGGFILSFQNAAKTWEVLHQDLMNIEQQYGKTHMLWLNSSIIAEQIINFLRRDDLCFGGRKTLLNAKLMMAEGNKWLTVPAKMYRKVHFCIVSLKPQNSKEAQKSAKDKEALLGKQSFGSWNLVHFANGLPSASKKISERTVLVNASVYEGLNLQRAVTKHCRNDSIVFLLDHDQTMSSQTDLQTLAKELQPIGNYAAFVKIKTDYIINRPFKWQSLNVTDKYRYINTNNKLYNTLANYLRAFTVQLYRLLSTSDLCHVQTGRYFNREVPFLDMLQLDAGLENCQGSQHYYRLKQLQRLIDIPRTKVYSNVTINSKSLKIVNTNSYQYRKFRAFTICQILTFSDLFQQKVTDMVVFNNGREEKGFYGRKGMPQIIPRKIHQSWLRGTMPEYKKFLINRLRNSHPDYEYYLWSEQNVTRQNFPQSYDLIQKLLKFDKKSPYNKFSMVADLMRYELVYRQGGFYLDTNYMLMSTERPLDKLLTYSLVVGGEHTPYHRFYKQSGLFGCPQFSPYMKRIQDHKMISTRNYFSTRADIVSGPWLLAKTIVGDQELNGDFFQPSLDETYPYFNFEELQYISPNKCEATKDTPDSQILFRGKQSYLKNCSKIYDYAIGMDFFAEGGTWVKRRW